LLFCGNEVVESKAIEDGIGVVSAASTLLKLFLLSFKLMLWRTGLKGGQDIHCWKKVLHFNNRVSYGEMGLGFYPSLQAHTHTAYLTNLPAH